MRHRPAASTLLLLGLVALWESLGRGLAVPRYLLPLPSGIAARTAELLPTLLYHSGITMLEALLGFAAAVVLSLALAAFFTMSETAEELLYPYVIAIKVTPVIATAPFLIIWFGAGLASKVVASMLTCFFPIVVNTTRGLKEIDRALSQLMRSFHSTRWEVLLKLKIPHSVPYIFAGLRTASTLSVVGAVVAEFVSANRGLGHFILMRSYYLETDAMFLGLAALACCGVSFYAAVAFIERRFFSRYGPAFER